MQIKTIKNSEDIAGCFDAFLELRPHLTDRQTFVDQVLAQQKEGYEIAAIAEENDITACIGFRTITTMAWGKILYIDDLITKEKYRGRGYARALLTYATDLAKQWKCEQIHLDTGYMRQAAHRAYLNFGFELHCHHLALKVG